jgi:hypothetical protein
MDDALREALRRETPPEGFAERVMGRVKAEGEDRSLTVAARSFAARMAAAFRRPQLRWATALAGVALAVGTVEYRNEMATRAEGERARDQVMLALKITGGKLRMTRDMVRRINYAPREQ